MKSGLIGPLILLLFFCGCASAPRTNQPAASIEQIPARIERVAVHVVGRKGLSAQALQDHIAGVLKQKGYDVASHTELERLLDEDQDPDEVVSENKERVKPVDAVFSLQAKEIRTARNRDREVLTKVTLFAQLVDFKTRKADWKASETWTRDAAPGEKGSGEMSSGGFDQAPLFGAVDKILASFPPHSR